VLKGSKDDEIFSGPPDRKDVQKAQGTKKTVNHGQSPQKERKRI